MTDIIADTLNAITVCERSGKTFLEMKKASKTLSGILEILKKEGYIEDFKVRTENKKSKTQVFLGGKINKCAAIKPRFPAKLEKWDAVEKRYLPGKDTGIIVVSTPKGMMTHNDAKEKGLGGRLVAYAY